MADQGYAAFRAIKQLFPKLSLAVSGGEIVEKLYSKDLIGEEQMDVAINQRLTPSSRGKVIVRELQRSVKVKPSAFHALVQILSEESITKELSETLEGTYKTLLEAEEKSSVSSQGSDIRLSQPDDEEQKERSGELCKKLEELKLVLEGHNKLLSMDIPDQESLYKTIQASIRAFTEEALKTISNQTIRDQIWSLCYKSFDIPTNLREWAIQEVDAMCVNATIKEDTKPASCPLPSIDQKLSMTKDILYHAGLCCQAVSTYTVANYKQFFSCIGHKFDEMSMSISQDRDNVDRYIIAKQGNIVYLAFQSEATLSKWIESPYKSFKNGLQKQMNRIPLKYLIELIGNQNKIVFTGFSFGGMLACCNAARLWKESVISVDTLENSVICITFGQPLLSIPYVEDTIKTIAKFESTLHSVYDQDDFFVRFLRDKYWPPTSDSRSKVTNGSTPPASQTNVPNLHHEFEGTTKTFLDNLATFQEQSNSDDVQKARRSMEALKTTFENCQNIESDITVYGECYLISTEKSQGLQWSKLPKMVVKQILHKVPIEKLTLPLKVHRMKMYQLKVFKAYLDKEPQKFIPELVSNKEVDEVPELKPQVESLNFHIYPGEHTVVLEGNNLWFCYEVHLGEKENMIHIKNSADISGRSIASNYPSTPKTNRLISDDKAKVKVKLHSHFANPIRKNLEVQQERCSFSLRQKQLAKHTPSEVIKLAFSCAMLESYSNQPDNAPSGRLSAITEFLEKAVKVVPIESIFYAIAYCELNTAVKCAEALLTANPMLPSSNETIFGLHRAVVRMRTGLHGVNFDSIQSNCLRNVKKQVLFREVKSTSLTAISRDELLFSASVPFYYPVHVPYAQVVAQGSAQLGQAVMDREFKVRLKLPPLPEDKANIIHPKVADRLEKFAEQKFRQRSDAVFNTSIEYIYPIADSMRRQSLCESTLKSPIKVLQNAREEIALLLNNDSDLNSSQGTQPSNEVMLELVREVIDHNLKICASLIGGFMEQTIRIPLLKSTKDTAVLLSETSSPVAMGVWALFSLNFNGLQNMLSRMQGNPLFLEIADYIHNISDDKDHEKNLNTSRYAGKLQFLLQGMRAKTISCSTEYISYSLEHQLCTNLKFDKDISVRDLIKGWDKIFEGDALLYVAPSHRSLVARWLKWAMLVHDLRESLAKYTCVGFTGLTNSGKSHLVSSLFGIQVRVGTTNRKRTTVPILYNLNGKVDGLDVIDFPGVDDNDHSIPELAKLLLDLSQIVVFVVDYRRISSDPAKEWLKYLKKADVHVIVCLTHADRLYAECIDESSDKDPRPTDEKARKIHYDLESKRSEIDHLPFSINTDYYCLHLPADTVIKRDHLNEVGIKCTRDVGQKLVKIFENIKQPNLATALQTFLKKRCQLA